MFAASALAGNTFLRSAFGAVFPLFATYMFEGIVSLMQSFSSRIFQLKLTPAKGINWSMTLLGCVAAIMIPLPVIFLLYGRKIRARSKFAPGYDLKMAQKMKEDEENASSGSEKGVDANETEKPTRNGTADSSS